MTAKLQLTAPMQGKKHRVHDWINTETLTLLYGVQCNIEYGVWAHVMLAGVVFLTPEKDDAKAYAKRWSKHPETTE